MSATNYYFLSKKIKIEEYRDIEIPEKGSIKIETNGGVKRIRGTGIYDAMKFKKIKETYPEANFYIKLNSKMPSIFCNYSIFNNHAKVVKNLLEFQYFMYDGAIVKEPDNFDFKSPSYDDSLFMYGEEAAKEYLWNALKKMRRCTEVEREMIYQEYESWFEFNNTRYFLIPDLSFRKPKLIKNGKEVINPDINLLYEKLFDINKYNELFLTMKIYNFAKFFSARNIFNTKAEIEEGLYGILSSGKKSLVKKEGISEKLSAAIRGTIVPNPYLKEDEIEIGTIFADYLYPEFMGLWSNAKELNELVSRGVLKVPKEIFKYEIDWLSEEEVEDMKAHKKTEIYDYFYPWWPERYSWMGAANFEKVNEEIKRRRLEFYKTHSSDVPYYCIVGRNPTICQLSMFSARPVFRDSIGNNFDNNEEGKKMKLSSLNSYVDEETGMKIFYTEYDEDIIAISPLVCDGMNADFDGDILLITPLFTEESNLEAANLKASLNYITVDSGNIRNKIPKEFIFTMKMLYEKAPETAAKINEILGCKGADYKAASSELKYTDRANYEEVFGILRDNIWNFGGGLTFMDMKKGLMEGHIENQLVQDLESEEDILALLNKKNKDYSSEDSEGFIRKVKASNVTEISESGYFYKKLASCMDSISTTIDDCGSEGTEVDVSTITGEGGEDFFDFKIKNMHIVELDRDYDRMDFLLKDLERTGLKKIHYRSPISCKEASKRCFCKKCCGNVSAGGRDLCNDNIGIIATLAITENVTQSSLSSMNKGISENVNIILEKAFSTKNNSTFDEYLTEIKEICNNMMGVGVESRWYEIALIGRVYQNPSGDEKDFDKYMSTTFISSSSRTNDKIGAFLFKPSKDNLFKLLCGESGYGNNFVIKSCKAKNLFGLF